MIPGKSQNAGQIEDLTSVLVLLPDQIIIYIPYANHAIHR